MTREHTKLASTIVEQLGGQEFLNKMGIKSNQEIRLFCSTETKEMGIKFRIESTQNKSYYTTCIITLQQDDTYRVIFYKGVFGYQCSYFDEVEGVYNDQLATVFKEYIGIEIPEHEGFCLVFSWE